jgi:hypothetical protein
MARGAISSPADRSNRQPHVFQFHGTKGLEWARSSFAHHPVIYVAGNHEYYGEALAKLTDELRVRATFLDIAFLENAFRIWLSMLTPDAPAVRGILNECCTGGGI